MGSLDSLVYRSEKDDDPALLFPWNECIDGEKPDENDICWMNMMPKQDLNRIDLLDDGVVSCKVDEGTPLVVKPQTEPPADLCEVCQAKKTCYEGGCILRYEDSGEWSPLMGYCNDGESCDECYPDSSCYRGNEPPTDAPAEENSSLLFFLELFGLI